MRIRRFSAAIGAGTVLALATTISAAQAYEVDAAAAHHSTSSRSTQTLQAIKAQFEAQAEFMKARAQEARAQEAQALKARAWYSDLQQYRWVR